MSPTRPPPQVVVLDRSASPRAVTSKKRAHQPPGLAHLAFSAVLRDPNGTMLVQRRATGAHHFPLRWSNTCCSHPVPGEGIRAAASRRLHEELGVRLTTPLTIHGAFWYRAADPTTGLVEVEYDVVVTGELPRSTRLRPDHRVVEDVAWIRPEKLHQLLERTDDVTPWFPTVIARLRQPRSPIAPRLPR